LDAKPCLILDAIEPVLGSAADLAAGSIGSDIYVLLRIALLKLQSAPCTIALLHHTSPAGLLQCITQPVQKAVLLFAEVPTV